MLTLGAGLAPTFALSLDLLATNLSADSLDGTSSPHKLLRGAEGEDGSRRLHILGLGGQLCTVTMCAGAGISDLRVAVEMATGIPYSTQRFFLDLQEVRTFEDLSALPEDCSLLLVRRSEQQLKWLERLTDLGSPYAARWLRNAPAEARADREIVLAAVELNGMALRWAAESLRADREVVLAAVATHGAALHFAADALRADREVVLAALRQSGGSALEDVAPSLKDDEEVLVAAEPTLVSEMVDLLTTGLMLLGGQYSPG